MGAAPNPTRGGTTVTFTLARTAKIRVAVYDFEGRLVRTLLDGSLEPGAHDIRWNGCDEAGRRTAVGLYLLRFEGDGVKESAKLLVMG
jgi:flagellar hook assembly protein FlgD